MSEKSMSENPQIILINGASSSGKSSLCKALQEHLAEPYIHLEEDRFVYKLTTRATSWQGLWRGYSLRR